MSAIATPPKTQFDDVMEVLEKIPFAVFQMFGFLWALRVYNLKPPRRVIVEQGIFGIMLTGVFITETIFWSKLYAFSLSPIIAHTLGCVMGALVTCLDRLIVVAVVEKNWRSISSVLARILCMGVGMYLTAMPLQITFNNEKIEVALNEKEKNNIDANLKAAIAKTEAVYDEDIKETERLLKEKLSGTETNTSGDVKNYTDERARRREKLLEGHKNRRKLLNDDYQLKSRLVRDEAGGRDEYGNDSGRGMGPGYEAKKKQETAAQDALLHFEEKALAEITKFDDETDKKVKALQDDRDTKVGEEKGNLIAKITSLRKQKQLKVEDLRELTPDQITAKFGGTYRVSRQALERYVMLKELEAKDSDVYWMCRKLEMMIGFFTGILLIIKFFGMSPESKLYYDLRYHVKLGDPEALAQAKALGYENTDRFALPLDVLKKQDEVYDARVKVADMVTELQRHCRELCRTAESAEEVRRQLRQFWNRQGRTALKDLDRKEYALRSRGHPMDEWPARLGGDPTRTQPWDISDEELASEYNWKAPVRPVSLHTVS